MLIRKQTNECHQELTTASGTTTQLHAKYSSELWRCNIIRAVTVGHGGQWAVIVNLMRVHHEH